MDSENLMKLAKKEYDSQKSPSHDWDHILRVRENALRIMTNENADQNIVLASVTLHDLGRMEGSEENHSHCTGKSEELLKKAGYSKEETKKVIDCIQSHSTNGNILPKTIEAKILFDADKIDSYGVTGVARFFALAGEKKWNLQEALKQALGRISRLEKITGFHTLAGKKDGFGKARRAFIFYYLLAKEIGDKEKVNELETVLEKKYGKIKATLFKALISFL